MLTTSKAGGRQTAIGGQVTVPTKVDGGVVMTGVRCYFILDN